VPRCLGWRKGALCRWVAVGLPAQRGCAKSHRLVVRWKRSHCSVFFFRETEVIPQAQVVAGLHPCSALGKQCLLKKINFPINDSSSSLSARYKFLFIQGETTFTQWSF